MAVSFVMILFAYLSVDFGSLQWSRKKRLASKDVLVERKKVFFSKDALRNQLISKSAFCLLIVLLLGGWAAYIWGAVTGHND